MAYLVAGPLVAIVGIVAVFFVLRRKSVEKRSMYSARRSQIEHKVRAARQRTMAPRGHSEKPAEAAPAAGSPFDQQQVQPTITYQTPAYAPPPVAPPPPKPEEPSAPMPWDTPRTPAPAPVPAPSTFDFPPAPAQPHTPPAPEPFRPAPEPPPIPAPSEPVWTPAPRPAEPMPPMEPVAPAASSTSAGAWSVVSTTKDGTTAAPESKKKDKDRGGGPTSSWQLASGDAPGIEADEPELKRPSGTLMAVAQYAILVVGLVMVLIGVLVMVANSHVT